MPAYRFHPDALLEYADAANYYYHEASPEVAEAFLSAVESAIAAIAAAPIQWRVAEEPSIRRYVFRRFPYVMYYRWEEERDQVSIYAIMHCSRKPDYWKSRIDRE